MPSFGSETGNVLYLIVCGAPPAADTPLLIKEKQDEGWDVVVIATPHGVQWFDTDEVERLTGHPVRTEFRKPTDPEFRPRGDAVLVAPATFNTINKWALGINDNLALGLLNEVLGLPTSVVVEPSVNHALMAHPAYAVSVKRLVGKDVEILVGKTSELHKP